MFMKRIDLEQENFSELRRQGLNPVDMHIHTKYSDASITTKALAKKARKLGFGCSVCDHNTIWGNVRLAKARDIFTVPGIEVTSSDAKDINLYFNTHEELKEFYTKRVKDKWRNNVGFNLNRTKLSVDEILDAGSEYDAFVMLPHPFAARPKLSYKSFLNDKKLLGKLHAVEVLNASIQKWRNEKAKLFAKAAKKPFIGGSDAHSISYAGRAITAAHGESIEEFLKNLKAGKAFTMGCEGGVVQRLKSNMIIFNNNITIRKKAFKKRLCKYDEMFNEMISEKLKEK